VPCTQRFPFFVQSNFYGLRKKLIQTFGMMGYGPGHMRLGPGSMMGDRQFGVENYGYGMNPFSFFFMGLIQLGVLALLGLSIAALIKYLRKK
jgi:hypothetical protein